jgi:hypothetical protein
MAPNPRSFARKRQEMVARRQRVAELWRNRQNQTDIARALGVDQSTISRDIKAIMREWRAMAVADVDEVIGRELAELDGMERDAAIRFAATHDPAWMHLRLRCKERRAKMLGLDSVQRVDVTSGGGRIDPITVIEVVRPDDG